MTRVVRLACSVPVLTAGSLSQASVVHALIRPSTAPAQTAGPASLGAPAPYDLALSGTGPGHPMTDTPAPTNVAITYYPGTWDPATAPRVGLATWILYGYYPYTNEPA